MDSPGALPPDTDRSAAAIQLAAKLYEARDYVRRMTTPDEYQKHIANYQDYIRKGMQKWNVTEIQATMALAGRLTDNPYVMAALFAAYVEMVGPELVQTEVARALKLEERAALF